MDMRHFKLFMFNIFFSVIQQHWKSHLTCLPSFSLYANLLFFNQVRLWPESKIKHIASLLSLHWCCLSNKQKWGRVEYATANRVSFPTINVFPLSSLQMAVTIDCWWIVWSRWYGNALFPAVLAVILFAFLGVSSLSVSGPLVPA